jgi:hypothetical protein
MWYMALAIRRDDQMRATSFCTLGESAMRQHTLLSLGCLSVLLLSCPGFALSKKL